MFLMVPIRLEWIRAFAYSKLKGIMHSGSGFDITWIFAIEEKSKIKLKCMIEGNNNLQLLPSTLAWWRGVLKIVFPRGKLDSLTWPNGMPLAYIKSPITRERTIMKIATNSCWDTKENVKQWVNQFGYKYNQTHQGEPQI